MSHKTQIGPELLTFLPLPPDLLLLTAFNRLSSSLALILARGTLPCKHVTLGAQGSPREHVSGHTQLGGWVGSQKKAGYVVPCQTLWPDLLLPPSKGEITCVLPSPRV